MSFKLSFKTPALTLVAFCTLASACSEQHKSTEPKVTPSKVEKLVQAEARSLAVDVPLTATAPATPRSILDSAKPSALGTMPVDTKEMAKEQASAEGTKPETDEAKLEPQVSAEQVKIDRFVLATDVSQREPVGESERFTTETAKIFAFMQFANEQAPLAVKVHWEKVGDPASPYGVQLNVPTAPRHRTWSWTKIRREPGTYRAVVRTLDGQELVSKEFVIEASPKP